jgi:hypothetical protein
MLTRVRRQQRAGEPKIRQGGRAALANEIEGQNVGAQAQSLDHIPRKARAQVAGAGADDDRTDVTRFHASLGERAFCGLAGERRRVPEKALREGIRVDPEDFVK